MWGRFVFREIVAPERIVFINSFSDENAGLTRAPFFDGKWPLEMLTVFSFEELGPGPLALHPDLDAGERHRRRARRLHLPTSPVPAKAGAARSRSWKAHLASSVS